jgi:hypothetical protein
VRSKSKSLLFLILVIEVDCFFTEEASGCRKASLSGAKRRAEESAKEAESVEVARGLAHAQEWPMFHACLEDLSAAEEKEEVKGVANLVPPRGIDMDSAAPS